MASTSLQCRGWEGGRGFDGSAAITSNGETTGAGPANLQRTGSGGFESTALILSSGGKRGVAATGAANLQRTGSGRFETSPLILSRGGKRGVAAPGGREPVAALRRMSRSASFGGAAASPWYGAGSNVFQSKSSHALRVDEVVAQAMEKLPANIEMLEAYEIEEKVRDYELDHYGVVNNAIYAQFCQHARHELLENVGFSPDAVIKSGKSMAIAEMSMKFLLPLRSGDRYIVSSRVSGTTVARIYFEDKILKLPNRELVVSAKATVVVLDQKHKPIRIPDDIKIQLLQYTVRNNSEDDQVQGKPTNLPTNTNVANRHVNGNATNGGAVNGKSLNGLINGKSRTGRSQQSQLNGWSCTQLN